MFTKTYVPTEAAGDWIMGRWRPTELFLTEDAAAYEVARGVLRLKEEPAPVPLPTPIPDAPLDAAPPKKKAPDPTTEA